MSRNDFLALAFSFLVMAPLAACSGGDDSSSTGSTTSRSSSCESSSSQAYGCINDRCACTGSKDYSLTKDEAEKKCAKSSGNCPAPSSTGTSSGTPPAPTKSGPTTGGGGGGNDDD